MSFLDEIKTEIMNVSKDQFREIITEDHIIDFLMDNLDSDFLNELGSEYIKVLKTPIESMDLIILGLNNRLFLSSSYNEPPQPSKKYNSPLYIRLCNFYYENRDQITEGMVKNILKNLSIDHEVKRIYKQILYDVVDNKLKDSYHKNSKAYYHLYWKDRYEEEM